jgi:Putative amidoligase enzyme.
MPSVVNEHNRNILALYGISLKKEQKAAAIMRLKDAEADTRINHGLYEKLLYAIESNATNYVMKLPNVTFGIELEFVGSKATKELANFNIEMYKLLHEKYFYSGAYTHNDGNSWILGRDSSIKYEDSDLPDPFGYELSSPKLDLFNEEDVNTVATVISYIKDYLHGYVNKSCGTHIHIGFKHDKIFRGSICDLLTAYSYMEKTVFDPIVPTSRRRNRFCRHTEPWPRNKYQKLSSRFCEFNYDGECRNLHFEFRQLEGTLDLNTIMYWAELQTCILYDLIDHIDDMTYVKSLMRKNIFDILFHYNFSSSLISFFINRVVGFKSRTILQQDQ